MKSDATRKWIAAVKVLAVDPSVRVRCPERDDGVLVVHDEPVVSDGDLLERYLVCDGCGARNVIRMRRPVE